MLDHFIIAFIDDILIYFWFFSVYVKHIWAVIKRVLEKIYSLILKSVNFTHFVVVVQSWSLWMAR